MKEKYTGCGTRNTYTSFSRMTITLFMSVMLAGSIFLSCNNDGLSTNTPETESIQKKEEKEVAHVPDEIRGTSVTDIDGGKLYISDCLKDLEGDVDGDALSEILCVRSMKSEAVLPCNSTALPIDVFKKDRWILRKKFFLDYFFDEFLFDVSDLDGDVKEELITHVRLGPHCKGCDAYRVYRFENGSFNLALSLFNVNQHHRGVSAVLRKTDKLQSQILDHYCRNIQKKLMLKSTLEDADIIRSDLWFVESEGTDYLVQLLGPFDEESFSSNPAAYSIYIGKLSSSGKLEKHLISPITFETMPSDIHAVGFLRTKDKRTHLLVLLSYHGTSAYYPVLAVFGIRGIHVECLGTFGGFYHHTISDRLQDVDDNGTTEIIFVDDAYWPPGKSHTEVIPEYSIVEYKNGKYVLVNEKFRNTLDMFDRILH